MFDVTEIVKLIITLVGLIITGFLIPYMRSKISMQNQELINDLVKIAVTAAEQIYRGSGRGKEKKEYVIKWLEERNIKVDADKIDAMIEAAVYELTHNGIFNTTSSVNESNQN